MRELTTRRGKAYDATGNHDRAIADYKEAIRLDPEMEEARKLLQPLPE
jgi:tetratricopeptide (TPR) repeat protein